jgi:hypothetical protein
MKVYQRIAQLIETIKDCEKNGNKKWYESNSRDLRDLENEYLPHGNGFDKNINVHSGNSKKFIIRFDWHCKADLKVINGKIAYNGWLTIDCEVSADLISGFNIKLSYFKNELQNDKAKVQKYKPLINDFLYNEFNHVLNQDVE